MGNWREFMRLKRMSLSYKATLLLTFFLTVVFDLTVAVEFGLVVACIFFLYRMNNITVVEPATLPFHMPDTVEAWHIRGALFFGSISKLEHVTDPHRLIAADSAKIVILDFTDLGPNLVPDMDFAMARADLVLAEMAQKEAAL